MRNALRVFARDFKRLLRVPKVWAIVIGIIVMPSLYAWVNIVAFWDPYSNTEDVKVAVVNLDEGATSTVTGALNVGDQVVAQLKTNDQLGWRFVAKDEAMAAVESGEYYAAYVIPADFSRQLLSVLSGDFTRPHVEYFVNEKANAIAPKITDVGASTLESQINGTFVSMVAKTVAEDVRKSGVAVGDKLLGAQESTLTALDEAVDTVASSRVGLADAQKSLSDAEAALADTKRALGDTEATIADVQSSVAQAQSLVAQVQKELTEFTDAVTTAYVSGAAHLSEASSKVNAMIAKLSAGTQQVNAEIGSAVTDAAAVVDANGKALERLEALLQTLDPADPAYASLSDAVDKLKDRNAADQRLLGDLKTLQGDASAVISAIRSSSDAMNAAVRDSADSASSVRRVLTGTIPDINRALSAMSASAGAFSSALGAQQVLVGQATDLLTGLQAQLRETVTALAALDGNLEGAQQGLETLRTDVTALGAAQLWSKVGALTGLDPQHIADFMAAPVQVKEHAVFPVKTYGSAMAPLFTNLSLWIAAFMLVVLLKQEVDTEGVEGLTVRQAYLGRFLLLGLLNVFQALLVSIGNVFIGVQLASPAAFVATSVFIGLVYVAIIFALAMSFGYIGKGLAVLLVIMQIPGASGIYPIEMMPGFFRALYPFFPFTYGISAMRETIGGFYDGYYWRAVGVLLLFAGLAFVLGIFVRQRLGNFSRLFNRKLAVTGLFVTEDVQILGSHRRLTQIVQALSDRAAFREKTARRAAWFDAHHLTVYRLALLIGLAATAVLALVGWLVPEGKATVLAVWGLLCLAVMGVIGTTEYIRQNIVFAARVGEMPVPALRRALKREELATHSDASLDELRERDAAEPEEAAEQTDGPTDETVERVEH